jgi:hypothetical protein
MLAGFHNYLNGLPCGLSPLMTEQKFNCIHLWPVLVTYFGQ